tara:strand:+ start:330 stop:803 length:474 start_codon:yes stop_codon:yes gene_type:complete
MQLIYDKSDGFIQSYDHPDSLDLSSLDNVISHAAGAVVGKRVKLADKSLVPKYDLDASITSGRAKLTVKTAYRGEVTITCSAAMPEMPTQDEGEDDEDFATRRATADEELQTFIDEHPPLTSVETITKSSQEVSLSAIDYKDSVRVYFRLAKAPVTL